VDSRLWTGALLVAAVLAVFYPVPSFDFVHYDDFDFVVQNSLLRMSWPDALRASLDPIHKNWIPLTWLSYRLDYAFFELQPAGYHATNVLLHAMASLVLYLTLFRVTGANGRSAFVAACFAVHPLHVESVAWVAERKDTLVGLFWMITVWCYVRHREQPQSVTRYGLVLAGLTLALLAKPVAVTLPFALLLLDYWPLARLSDPESAGWPRLHLVRKAVLEKLPLFALVGAASVMTYSAQGAVMDELGELGLGWKLANAAHSYGLYAFDAIWPMNLVVFYPHPMEAISLWQTGVASFFLLGTTLALGRLAASHPYAIVGWLWFLGTLVPMLGLVQVGTQSRADRYMYIPLVGLSILVAWGAVDVAKRMRIPEMALKAIAALAILLLGVTAWFQLGAWRDTESLYLHALDASEGNYLAHKGLANEFLRLGRVEQAEFHYQAAIQLRPEWQSPRLGLIDLTMMQGGSVEC
jgi:hypothetical protein